MPDDPAHLEPLENLAGHGQVLLALHEHARLEQPRAVALPRPSQLDLGTRVAQTRFGVAEVLLGFGIRTEIAA